jgi:hypothetical protein
MNNLFLVFENHLINTSQIASASDTPNGLHINMIGGGFFDIPDMTVTGLESRLNGAAF